MTEQQLQSQDMKVIVFELLDKEYAIEVDVVQSIERVMSITRVPNTPAYVKGVINLRGVVTPIIDLRSRFELETREMDETTRIIVISLNDNEVGFVVDSANDVLDIPRSSIEPQPEVVGSIESEFILGVAKVEKRLFVMLDLEKILMPLSRGGTE